MNIIGPPTHSVGGQISNGRWRLSSVVVCRRRLSSVTLPAGRPSGRPAVRRVGGRAADTPLWASTVTSLRATPSYKSIMNMTLVNDIENKVSNSIARLRIYAG